MRTMPIRELNQNVSAVIASVEAGEPVQLTRRGKTVARIVPEPAPAEASAQRKWTDAEVEQFRRESDARIARMHAMAPKDVVWGPHLTYEDKYGDA